MQVLAYGRISNAHDDNETSLQNQREMVEDYADQEELEVVNWYQDRNISGNTDPFERDGFSALVAHLQESDITTILVKNGKRLVRGESADDIESELRGQLGHRVKIIKTHPEEMEELEDEVPKEIAPIIRGTRETHEKLEIKEAKEAGRLTAERKRQNDQPFHRPPRGVTTDKQKFPDQERATEWLPKENADESYNQFRACVKILNEYATTDKSTYQVGKEHGVPSPTKAVDDMWEMRETYRALAQAHYPSMDLKF